MLEKKFADDFSRQLNEDITILYEQNSLKVLTTNRKELAHIKEINRLKLSKIDSKYIEALIDNNKIEEALLCCETLLSKKKNQNRKWLWYVRGLAYEKQDDSYLAAASYHRALSIDSKFEAANSKLAKVLDSQSQKFSQKIRKNNIPIYLEQTISKLKEIPQFMKVLDKLNLFYKSMLQYPKESLESVEENMIRTGKKAIKQLTISLYDKGGWQSLLLAAEALPIFDDIYNILGISNIQINEKELFNKTQHTFFKEVIECKL